MSQKPIKSGEFSLFTSSQVLNWTSEILQKWDNLALNASTPNVFYESHLLRPALRHLTKGNQNSPKLLCLFDKNSGDSQLQMDCLLPIVERSKIKHFPIKHLANWKYIHCYLAHPLIRKNCEEKVLKGLFDWLSKTQLTHAISFEYLHGDSLFSDELRTFCRKSQFSFFEESFHRAFFKIERRPNFETYLKEHYSPKRRKEFRRKKDRLSEKGKLEINFRPSENHFSSWTHRFLELESKGWKGQEGSAMSSRPEDKEFFSEVLNGAYHKKALISPTMELNGKMIAGEITLLSQNGGFSFKIAYDEDFSSYSPGNILILEHLRTIYENQSPHWLDPCTNPNHSLANRLLEDRKKISHIYIGTRPFPEIFILKYLLPAILGWKRKYRTNLTRPKS